MTESTALTLDDIEKSIASLGRIPRPPMIRARPAFVEMLWSKLPQANPSVMGHVEIDIVPDLPFRWEYRYDGKTTLETLDGQTFSYESPKMEDLLLPLPREPEYQHPIRVRWSRPTAQFPMLYMGGIEYGYTPPKRERRKRASKGWRKHVRRMKAEGRQQERTGS